MQQNKEYVSIANALYALLDYSERVTLKYVQLKGGWTINDQLAHAHSEISEVYQAIRHGEGINRVISENIDVIFDAITLPVVIRLNAGLTISDLKVIMSGELNATMNRLESRIAQLTNKQT